MTRWRVGDIGRVRGEDGLFVVREKGPVSAYLARVDGSDGALGHGREGFNKMARVPMAERRKIAAGMRRTADLLDPPKETP